MNSSKRALSESDKARGTLLRRLMSISMAEAGCLSCDGSVRLRDREWRRVSARNRGRDRRGGSFARDEGVK